MSNSSQSISLDDWLQATAETLAEVCTTTLMYDGCTLGEKRADNPELTGAYIALVGEDNAVQIAIAGTPEVCAQLSACLLGMEPEEADDLTEADIADGIGELVNMVAGGVKTRLVGKDAGIQLGLPFVVEGRVERANSTKVTYCDADLGQAQVVLIVIGDAKVAFGAAA